jgi:hypothetical protein
MQARKWSFMFMTRIIFEQPLMYLMVVMWQSIMVLKPHMKTCIEGHTFQ